MFSAKRLSDWVLLLLCNLIWASQFVLVKIVQEQLGPVAATSFPMLIATVLLVPIVRIESRLQQTSIQKGALLRDWRGFLILGVLGQVVAQLFVTWVSVFARIKWGAVDANPSDCHDSNGVSHPWRKRCHRFAG